MKCLNCSGEEFDTQSIRLSSSVKGELLEVIIPCNVCKKCSTPFMNTAQINTLRRSTSDAYREKNSLLTSKQIIQFRENLGMSQLAFANYLKVGEASVKRWESFYIQDYSQDNLIRLKCDLTEAEQNYFYLSSVNEKSDHYNGNRKFSFELFDNVASFFLHSLTNAEYFLRKLHFYADFLHFKNHENSITGIKYIPLKDGPSPCLLNLFSREHQFLYEPKPFKRELFDDREMDTLQAICKLYKTLGSEKLVNLCKSEKGYKETPEDCFISYKFASDLLI